MKKEVPVVFLAGGLSSRFEGRIKPLIPVGSKGESLIECNVQRAISAGFKKIIFVVGNSTQEPFKIIFGHSYKKIPVEYYLQNYDETTRNRPWGLVDALSTLHPFLNYPFVFCSGGDLYHKLDFQSLINHLSVSSDNAVVGYRLWDALLDEGAVNRIILSIKDDQVVSLKKHFNVTKRSLTLQGLQAEMLCSLNLFAIQPDTLALLVGRLMGFKDLHGSDPDIECSLAQELDTLLSQKQINLKVYPAKGKWIGLTHPQDEQIVREFLEKGN